MGYIFNQTSGVNKNYFQYQKQQRIEDFDLNIDFFKYRPSDPTIGRFWQIDPLSSQFPHNSPYALQENKFGMGVELEGKELQPFYPNVQGELWRGAGFGYEPGQSESYQIAKKLSVSAGKSMLTIALMALPVEELVFSGLGLIAKELGFLGKAEANLMKESKFTEIVIDAEKHPESAKHLKEAIDAGKSNEGVIDRAGANSRRKENMKGSKPEKGKDRDEAPPALINTGQQASVKKISPSDNRGAGASIKNQTKKLKDGTPVRIVPKNLPNDGF